jgi:hypothetical protein
MQNAGAQITILETNIGPAAQCLFRPLIERHGRFMVMGAAVNQAIDIRL